MYIKKLDKYDVVSNILAQPLLHMWYKWTKFI